jgi:3-oxoadipate enol-lactonase/4-carboxymuconolactone decarboxylase
MFIPLLDGDWSPALLVLRAPREPVALRATAVGDFRIELRMPFVTTRDGRLYYEVHDLTPPWLESPPALVLHHGIAADLNCWSHWLPHFCTHYRIIAFDARGCGRSTPPGHSFTWTLDQLARDVLDVAQAAGANSFHFVGDAIGAAIGIHLAANRPDRILSLAAANAVTRGDELREMMAWSMLIDAEGQSGWARQMMAWRYAPDALPERQARWLQRQLEVCHVHSALAMSHVFMETVFNSHLAAVGAPTLLLCAEKNPFVPAGQMAELESRIPGAEQQRFSDALDGLVVSHARACAEAVRAFHARRCKVQNEFPATV